MDKIVEKINALQKDIEFDDLLHKYWFKGKETISVTQLLAKHGISPSYSSVNSELLKKSAQRGTLIHKDIEDCICYGSYVSEMKENCETEEADRYFELLLENNLIPLYAEFMVANDCFCGTCDALLKNTITGKYYIDDHKTGTIVHREAVRWQCSIYAYLLGVYDEIDGIICSHLPKDLDKCELIYLDKIPLKEIEKLIECEKNGLIYGSKTIYTDDMSRLQEVSQQLLEVYEEYEKLKNEQAKLKDSVLATMQKEDVWNLDFYDFKITRKKGSVRTTVDSSKLKTEMPEIYEKFSKTTNIAESIVVSFGGK